MSIQFAPKWNSSDNAFTCIVANVTDISSGAGSTVLSLGINGVSIFAVDKNNNVIIKESTPTTPSAGYISVYAQNGKLNIIDSTGSIATLPRITSGTAEPSDGSTGDIYLQY